MRATAIAKREDWVGDIDAALDGVSESAWIITLPKTLLFLVNWDFGMNLGNLLHVRERSYEVFRKSIFGVKHDARRSCIS